MDNYNSGKVNQYELIYTVRNSVREKTQSIESLAHTMFQNSRIILTRSQQRGQILTSLFF